MAFLRFMRGGCPREESPKYEDAVVSQCMYGAPYRKDTRFRVWNAPAVDLQNQCTKSADGHTCGTKTGTRSLNSAASLQARSPFHASRVDFIRGLRNSSVFSLKEVAWKGALPRPSSSLSSFSLPCTSVIPSSGGREPTITRPSTRADRPCGGGKSWEEQTSGRRGRKSPRRSAP